jgi:predicted ArsR family transcriptional regulator
MGIDERAREEWVARTDGFERVKTTLETTRQSKSAGEIADEALVSEKTARKYLQRLADLNAASVIQDERTTRYKRDTDAFIAQRIRELRTDHSRQELIDGIQRMRAEIESFREKHDVDSSTELAMSLESGERDEAWEDLSDWRTTERNLSLAQAALSFDRAAERVKV